MVKDYISKGTEKGTLLFIHGNSSSAKIFEDILNDTTISNTKIALELSGHGASNRVEGDFSINGYSKEILDYLSFIKDEIILVGHSLGAHLIIEIAEKVKNLKSIIIFGAPPLKKPINIEEAFNPIPELSTFFMENPEDHIIEVAVEMITNSHQQNAEKVIKDFKSTNPKVRSTLAKDLESGAWKNQYEIFKNLNFQKFIIRGKQDPIVNTNYLEILSKEAKKCSIIDIDECGHYPSIEKPKEFIKIIRAIAQKIL